MAPFPTGPLAVFSRDLASSLFVECAYLREYERSAREWGRKTLCKGPKAHLTFASTLCDTVISHWIARCNVDVTVAHTTRTKSHHYMWRGAGLGWMPPSNLSLAVHYLKAKPLERSGPNMTRGGEWSHTHATLSRAEPRVAFPPLLYSMPGSYSLSVSRSRKLLTSINPDVFHWYSAECSFEHAELRKAGIARANLATALVRGPRPPGMNDAKYLGGHPPGWPFSGCNPSRFRPYPVWPPPPDVHTAIRSASVHDAGSPNFVYFGHGPSVAQLQPGLAAATAALAKAGGAWKLKPTEFELLLAKAMSPHRIAGGSARPIHFALRKAEGAGQPLAELHKLLEEMVQARLSLEAFVESVARMSGGLSAESAQRDNTYYWNWA